MKRVETGGSPFVKQLLCWLVSSDLIYVDGGQKIRLDLFFIHSSLRLLGYISMRKYLRSIPMFSTDREETSRDFVLPMNAKNIMESNTSHKESRNGKE